MSTHPPDADTTTARLAREHDAPTLAAALVARLRADGRAELAAVVVAALSGDAGPHDDPILDPNPLHPHEET